MLYRVAGADKAVAESGRVRVAGIRETNTDWILPQSLCLQQEAAAGDTLASPRPPLPPPAQAAEALPLSHVPVFRRMFFGANFYVVRLLHFKAICF